MGELYSLAFCRPDETVRAAENLGEVMTGAVIQNSPYDIFMGKSEFKIACRSVLTKPQKQALSQRVRQDYRVHMIMDNLPAATKMIAELPDGSKKDMYDRGFRLGFLGSKDIPGTEPGKPYVNNHLRFIVKYHKSELYSGARIVGFEVEAYSVKHSYNGEWDAKAPKLTSVPLRPDLPPMPAWAPEIVFTYDVVWEYSDIAWASRWDLYLYMGDDQVHWFSILNSLVIVLLLSGIVAMIMVRTLRRDLAEYNSVEEKEELLEESGWKLVHADVLRTPPNPTLLAVSVGTGMQVLCMAFISIACAMLGFLSPANRGSMLSVRASHSRRNRNETEVKPPAHCGVGLPGRGRAVRGGRNRNRRSRRAASRRGDDRERMRAGAVRRERGLARGCTERQAGYEVGGRDAHTSGGEAV